MSGLGIGSEMDLLQEFWAVLVDDLAREGLALAMPFAMAKAALGSIDNAPAERRQTLIFQKKSCLGMSECGGLFLADSDKPLEK
jgi:hypothetical protein